MCVHESRREKESVIEKVTPYEIETNFFVLKLRMSLKKSKLSSNTFFFAFLQQSLLRIVLSTNYHAEVIGNMKLSLLRKYCFENSIKATKKRPVSLS